MRSFDNLASVYSILERTLFWNQLERARAHGLQAFDPETTQRALALGDGDGRFSAIALKRNPRLRIDSVDSSPAMLNQATKRIEQLGPDVRNRFQPIQADAREHSFERNDYDVVVAQFFLDCFSSEDANRLLERAGKALRPEGTLVYADFTARSGKRLHRWIVKLLYSLFRLTTDIESRTLPKLAWPYSLKLDKEKRWNEGLIVSEIRRKRAS